MSDKTRPIPSDATEELRHVHIETGDLTLDYTASTNHAEDIADELSRTLPGAIVTIDDNVREHFPPLPCGELWQ